jgi:MYXO-CTERM domain-containing protein
VWAGGGSTDCSKSDNRGVASNACWLVYRATPRGATWQIDIRAQDIVAQNYPSKTGSLGSGGSGGTNGSGGTGGTSGSGGTATGGTGGTTTTSSILTPGTAATCEEGGASDALLLTFMFVQNNAVVGTTAQWNQTGVDVTPPPPPSGVTVEPGENRLLVKWTTDTPNDLLEWRFYCDPKQGAVMDMGGLINGTSTWGSSRQALEAGVGGSPGTSGDSGVGGNGAGGGLDAGSGGASAAGGTSGSGGSGENCLDVPTILVAGEVPPEANLCGKATGDTQRDGHADGLANNVAYAVGMVGVDERGNVGKLSDVKCGMPVPQTDGFELYKEYGGKGGGGFCSVSSRRDGLSPAIGLGALSVVGLGLLRRRKRNV